MVRLSLPEFPLGKDSSFWVDADNHLGEGTLPVIKDMGFGVRLTCLILGTTAAHL